jgi:hypothetical protein
LASFVRALAETGSRCWSADKLSTLTQPSNVSRERPSTLFAFAIVRQATMSPR